MSNLTYPTDAILTAGTAQTVFGSTDADQLVRLVSSLSAKFKQFTNRVAISPAASITETIRPGVPTEFLYLHAYLDTSAEITVTEYSNQGTVSRILTKTGGDLLAASSDWASRVDGIAVTFAAACRGSYTTVEYTGGWSEATMPGDVVTGAIMQGRIELARMRGDVGASTRSRGKETKTEMDQSGLLKTVADMWRPYKVMI